MSSASAAAAASAGAGSASSPSTTAQAETLVRKENELKAKRDQNLYEGLPEGITLGRKMGDGAFSHVFEAILRPSPAQLAIDPTMGKQVKVAVKCVRKFELNSSQVRPTLSRSFRSRLAVCRSFRVISSVPSSAHIGSCASVLQRTTSRHPRFSHDPSSYNPGREY